MNSRRAANECRHGRRGLLPKVAGEQTPLGKGGVAAPRNKMSRSLLSGRRRARSASATARSIKYGWFKSPIDRSLNEPLLMAAPYRACAGSARPRLLRQRWLRGILFMSRPPLLYQGGEFARLYQGGEFARLQ